MTLDDLDLSPPVRTIADIQRRALAVPGCEPVPLDPRRRWPEWALQARRAGRWSQYTPPTRNASWWRAEGQRWATCAEDPDLAYTVWVRFVGYAAACFDYAAAMECRRTGPTNQPPSVAWGMWGEIQGPDPAPSTP